jgi:formimidoylglutamate deiminase
MATNLWAASALLPNGWQQAVEVAIDDVGNIAGVRAGQPSRGAERVGVLVPGVPNAHSHAHQRAMAGLAECADTTVAGPGPAREDADGFWRWREVMYRHLERLGPEHLRPIAAQLYLEMLKAGYTSVCEFQYLHHDPSGHAYSSRAQLSLECVHAARDVGIGITMLPVLYRYGGFGAQPPTERQRRFINDADGFAAIIGEVSAAVVGDPNAQWGIAPHSLRAVDAPLLREVIDACPDAAVIHLHIAEQKREVAQCVHWCGRRPVQWLTEHVALDHRWTLVHATHAEPQELDAVASHGSVIALCPTTEANLGDGFFDAGHYLGRQGAWAIGSDSQISVSPIEELRWLEYGQRLVGQRRNVLVGEGRSGSTARRLLDDALAGGAAASGRNIGAIAPGRRADLLVLDEQHPRLAGAAGDTWLDCWIFSGNQSLVKDVYVGGRRVIADRHHAAEAAIARDFRAALAELAA